jgi:hypothetical protein
VSLFNAEPPSSALRAISPKEPWLFGGEASSRHPILSVLLTAVSPSLESKTNEIYCSSNAIILQSIVAVAATDERRRTKPLAGVDLLDRALSDVSGGRVDAAVLVTFQGW